MVLIAVFSGFDTVLSEDSFENKFVVCSPTTFNAVLHYLILISFKNIGMSRIVNGFEHVMC